MNGMYNNGWNNCNCNMNSMCNNNYNYMSPCDMVNANMFNLQDYGPAELAFNIDSATKRNKNYRTALWSGNSLQLTLMSLNPGEDIGLEIHPDTDQFLRIEDGCGVVKMGKSKDNLNYQINVNEDYAIIVPAGIWHNVINTGKTPLKLYTIYAPPHHPYGTVHQTKAIAQASENHY